MGRNVNADIVKGVVLAVPQIQVFCLQNRIHRVLRYFFSFLPA